MTDLDPFALACHAASLCHGMSAEDVVLLRMPEGSEFSYVVLATARSERQSYAVVDDVLGFCKKHHIDHRPVEGEAGWYLLDCHQVVIHALGQPQRAFYQFERLWKKAEKVDWETAFAKLPKLPDAAGAPSQRDGAGVDVRRSDTMGEAHPTVVSEALPTKPSTDKARGVGPKGRRGEAPDV